MPGLLHDLATALFGPDRPPPPATRPRSRWRDRLIPVWVLGFVWLTVQHTVVYIGTSGLGPLFGGIIGGLMVVPLAVAMRRPLWAWRLALVVMALDQVLRGPDEGPKWYDVQLLAGLAVLAMVAARYRPGVSVWVGGVSTLPFVAGDVESAALLVLLVLLLGDQIRRRRDSQSALAVQAEISELANARRAVLEERTRIAREMHDVVAHHMSMIAVRAETAPFRLSEVPEPVRAELVDIAVAARAAMSDMRRLLSVLRSEEAAPRAPQPGLPDLPALLAQAGGSGMTISASGVESPPDVPEPVGLAAYRIAQESLANAGRHAPGQPVNLCLVAGDRALVVEVRNDLPAGPTTSVGTGHGTTGMRERAQLLGGTLIAGPDGAGGYRVRAELPYGAEGAT